jgi:hypothetical protein
MDFIPFINKLLLWKVGGGDDIYLKDLEVENKNTYYIKNNNNKK